MPSYENVPLPDTSPALTVEEAARHAGKTLPRFRALMTELNNTPADLRTPKKSGEKARKYDLQKLDNWISKGMPTPDHGAAPTPNAHTINATATYNGTHWLISLPELDTNAEAQSLSIAHRLARTIAAQRTGIPANEIKINITPELPAQTVQRWAQAKQQEQDAQELAAAAAKLSREVVQDLKEIGLTSMDIASLLGISPQRARQLASDAATRKEGTPHENK